MTKMYTDATELLISKQMLEENAQSLEYNLNREAFLRDHHLPELKK